MHVSVWYLEQYEDGGHFVYISGKLDLQNSLFQLAPLTILIYNTWFLLLPAVFEYSDNCCKACVFNSLF